MRRVAACALLLLCGAAPAPVTVTHAWFRTLPGDLPAAGYFTLHNGTAKTLTLTGVATKACGMAMLHKSNDMGGMSSMEDVSTVDVAPGKDLVFAPGGYHVMCMSPAMRRGANVAVTLQFAGGSTLPVTFAVRGANGK